MLRGTLIHPQILGALGAAGHGSLVLIADGNYPFTTGTNPAATHVYLNLAPGLISATDALRAITSAIPVEKATVMTPDDGSTPAIFAEFEGLLPGLPLTKINRFPFYDMAKDVNTALVIATAEQRIYANILLTIGVIMP
jgi:L-fucose mutarotase